MNRKITRSPLFYVGDKYRLMQQLLKLFPQNVNNFYEPFVGGGTVFLNIDANNYFLNDVNNPLIEIHKFLISNADTHDLFFKNIESVINKYALSKSYKKDIVPDRLKKKFKKTYYAEFNKIGYQKLKSYLNRNRKNDPLLLYILLIYGFNRMLRFNKEGSFNLPVGNVDFNKNVVNALNDYFEFVEDREIKFFAKDFKIFLKENKYKKEDFVYIDPPYLITASEYNKLWNKEVEIDLFDIVDNLNSQSIKFALSNVTHYNGNVNTCLIDWMKKYRVHKIESNYINYHNNGKKEIKEVLITNY